ncbi:MAG: hypothetical protein NTU73_08150 [Ignavibacteriae bacterium]|nr:hypothetical protein [Ignavibacteriota bacterium]
MKCYILIFLFFFSFLNIYAQETKDFIGEYQITEWSAGNHSFIDDNSKLYIKKNSSFKMVNSQGGDLGSGIWDITSTNKLELTFKKNNTSMYFSLYDNELVLIVVKIKGELYSAEDVKTNITCKRIE